MESPEPNADRKHKRSSDRISLQTLIIASVASAAASFAASRIWGAGTLISAAATPVIVALVSEFLRRPVQTVAETAKKIPNVQALPVVHTHTISAPSDSTPAEDATQRSTDPAAGAEPQPPSGQPPGQTDEAAAAITPVVDAATTESTDATTWRPRWRLAVLTGLLAFAIVVAIFTVPDLIAGRSITDNGQPTTFFGGSSSAKKKESPGSAVTTSTRTTTATTSTTTTTTVSKTAPARTTATTTSAATSRTTTSTSPAGAQGGITPTTTTAPVP